MSNGLLTLKRDQALYYTVGGIVALCLALLFSGYGLLVGETETDSHPYATGTTVRIGNVDVPGEMLGTIYFSCSYFTGRGVAHILLDASDGYHQCPFLMRV
jgi:hypothetical protein